MSFIDHNLNHVIFTLNRYELIFFFYMYAGKGIGYVIQELFQESAGMRMDVAHVLVLITDGRAQDDVEPPSRIARALGQ